MCAPHPIDPANLLAPIETAVPPEEEDFSNTETQRHGGPEEGGMSALDACGYRVEEDAAGGRFAISLETPYEGASIQAGMAPRGDSGRFWAATVRVLNCRGLGWSVRAEFEDTPRWVAKQLLVTLALDMRRQYCHRGQKVRRRSIARAIARRQAEEAAHA